MVLVRLCFSGEEDLVNEIGDVGRQDGPPGVPGLFFTDHSCTSCELCREMAPEVFRADEDGFTFVWRQPTTPDELELALEGMEGCPTATIGRDF